MVSLRLWSLRLRKIVCANAFALQKQIDLGADPDDSISKLLTCFSTRLGLSAEARDVLLRALEPRLHGPNLYLCRDVRRENTDDDRDDDGRDNIAPREILHFYGAHGSFAVIERERARRLGLRKAR